HHVRGAGWIERERHVELGGILAYLRWTDVGSPRGIRRQTEGPGCALQSAGDANAWLRRVALLNRNSRVGAVPNAVWTIGINFVIAAVATVHDLPLRIGAI